MITGCQKKGPISVKKKGPRRHNECIDAGMESHYGFNFASFVSFFPLLLQAQSRPHTRTFEACFALAIFYEQCMFGKRNHRNEKGSLKQKQEKTPWGLPFPERSVSLMSAQTCKTA